MDGIITTGFKVVFTKTPLKLLSYNVWIDKDENSLTTIEYKQGEWVYPKIENSLLFVFQSLKEACCWSGINYFYSKEYYELWSCECLDMIPYFPLCSDNELKIQEYWSDEDKSKYKHIPMNSFGAKAIKLVREIPIGEYPI